MLGIDGSPTCGVETIWEEGQDEPGQGVLIQELVEASRRRDISFQIKGIKAAKPGEAIATREGMLRALTAKMIARVWKGWTKAEDAGAYEKLLREVVYPELQAIKGYHGGYILRHDSKDETEFVAVNFFESLDAVKAFAGPDYEVPVFEPEARRLLSKVEPIARHYDVRKAPPQQAVA